jgi:hypothetical protein
MSWFLVRIHRLHLQCPERLRYVWWWAGEWEGYPNSNKNIKNFKNQLKKVSQHIITITVDPFDDGRFISIRCDDVQTKLLSCCGMDCSIMRSCDLRHTWQMCMLVERWAITCKSWLHLHLHLQHFGFTKVNELSRMQQKVFHFSMGIQLKMSVIYLFDVETSDSSSMSLIVDGKLTVV